MLYINLFVQSVQGTCKQCALGWPIFKSRIKTGGDKKIWGKYEFPCA